MGTPVFFSVRNRYRGAFVGIHFGKMALHGLKHGKLGIIVTVSLKNSWISDKRNFFEPLLIFEPSP